MPGVKEKETGNSGKEIGPDLMEEWH